MSEPIPLFPTRRVDPARFAAAQHVEFRDHNLRIGRSDTVHTVIWVDWINGLTLPSPACRQGWSGLGSAGELTPTRHPVTCAKCRRLRGLPIDDGDPEQIVLFPLG